MKPLEISAGQMEWVARNLAHNLDFIPDDKLDWKPAPTAGSALEIVNHILSAIERIGAHLAGREAPAEEFQPAQNREDAKQRLIEAALQHAAYLRTVESTELERKVETSFGTFPLGFLATIPVSDTLHHHGQIAYIQTLLGDTESHFDLSLLPG